MLECIQAFFKNDISTTMYSQDLCTSIPIQHRTYLQLLDLPRPNIPTSTNNQPNLRTQCNNLPISIKNSNLQVRPTIPNNLSNNPTIKPLHTPSRKMFLHIHIQRNSGIPKLSLRLLNLAPL